MKKFLIGTLAATMLMVSTVSADASTRKQAINKIANYAGKACDSVSNFIWRNKGTVAVCTVATVAVTNPVSFAEGVATIMSGTLQTIHLSTIASVIFYVLMLGLLFVGVRYAWKFTQKWRMLPLLIIGALLCFWMTGGTAEAGAIAHAPEIQCGVIRPWWGDIVGIILFIIAIFV